MSEKKKSVGECKMYKQGTWYTLTINPPDSKQFFNMHTGREFKFISYWHDQLLRLKLYAEFELYVEVSLKGRLHFHGKVNPKDTLNFLLYGVKILESFGIYEIDTIEDMKTWKKYYMKDQKYWLKRLKPLKKTYPLDSTKMKAESEIVDFR